MLCQAEISTHFPQLSLDSLSLKFPSLRPAMSTGMRMPHVKIVLEANRITRSRRKRRNMYASRPFLCSCQVKFGEHRYFDTKHRKIRTTSPVGIARIASSHFHQPRGRATARLLVQTQFDSSAKITSMCHSTHSGGGRYVLGSYILLIRCLRKTNARSSTARTPAFVAREVRKVCESRF